MKALQNEKVKYEKELEALKAAKPLKTSSEDAERIKTLEAQIAELKKTVSDSTIENNRLKASNSMNTNRSKKLMDEINKMKTLLDKTIADKAKLAAKAPEATKAGDKRTREDGELDDDVSPSKKPVA
jgi:SMC interacting uncharacterized protein involved in chromosome segregation